MISENNIKEFGNGEASPSGRFGGALNQAYYAKFFSMDYEQSTDNLYSYTDDICWD